MFSLLPGIGRPRYRYIVVDQTFTSGGVDCVTYIFIDHHRVSFFRSLVRSSIHSSVRSLICSSIQRSEDSQTFRSVHSSIRSSIHRPLLRL